MGKSELERVKADLEIMKSASGMDLSFGWSNVKKNIAWGALGFLLTFISVFTKDGFEFFAILLIGALIIEFSIRTDTKKRPSTKSYRDNKRSFWEWVVVLILLSGYFVWSEKLELPREYEEGVIFLICGSILALKSFSRFGNLYSLGYAIPLMLCGIFLPLFSTHYSIITGLALGFGGLSVAAVQVFRLKRTMVENAPN